MDYKFFVLNAWEKKLWKYNAFYHVYLSLAILKNKIKYCAEKKREIYIKGKMLFKKNVKRDIENREKRNVIKCYKLRSL